MRTQAQNQLPSKEQIDKAMADAVRMGNTGRASELFARFNADPDATLQGIPLLSLAVKLKSTKMAELLLQNGANPNAPGPGGDSALMLAARLCRDDVMRAILLRGGSLEQRNAKGETAASIALAGLANCRAAELKLVYRELEAQKKQTDQWLKLALAMLATDPNPDAKVDGHPALTLAVLLKDPAELNRLIEAGADVNAANPEGDTALILAVRAYKPEFTALLLEKGASPVQPNHDGENAAVAALQKALECQNVENEGYDFKRKEQIKETDKWLEFGLGFVAHPSYDPKAEGGHTALVVAACLRNPAAFETLLQKGADISAADTSGHTALHAAAVTGNAALVEKLLGMGASLLQQNKDKQRPADLAALAMPAALQDIERCVANKALTAEEAKSRTESWKKLVKSLTVVTDSALDALEAPLEQPLPVRNKPLQFKPKVIPR